MKKQTTQSIEIPSDVNVKVEGRTIVLTKSGKELRRNVSNPDVSIAAADNKIMLSFRKNNKRTRAMINSLQAHIQNMLAGFKEDFVYEMEICNVHFPMTVKVEGNLLVINNFLGEKVKRIAKILPSVTLEIKGSHIVLSSHDLEAVSQTAANIEKATNVPKRDRRVFQDGIFMISKAGRSI